MSTLKVYKLVDTEYEYTDGDWEKLCELFNEGEYSDSIECFTGDKEAWEALEAFNKVLHDLLMEFVVEGTDYITVQE